MAPKFDGFKNKLSQFKVKNLSFVLKPMAVLGAIWALSAGIGYPNPMGLFGAIRHHSHLIQEHLEEVRRIDLDYRRVTMENGKLRRWVEEVRFDCAADKTADKTETQSHSALKETGAKSGRGIASISYTPPTNLLPTQLYTLGIKYLEVSEFEKAAVIFTRLAEYSPKTEDSDFRTPMHFLLTGLSWYRVDNYKQAGLYFDRVLDPRYTELQFPNLDSQRAQARLWKAVIAKKLGQEDQVESWLRDLIGSHPKSQEAKWVNPDLSH